MNPQPQKPQPTLADLTRRQREVLHWLSEGKSASETAIILACAASTVKGHRCDIYRILGVPNAVSAANFYHDATGQ